MRELRQLVQQFIEDGIAYGDFRRDVVARFLGLSDQDQIVAQLYDEVEAACSAYEHQYVDVAQLKSELGRLPWPVEQAQAFVFSNGGSMSMSFHVRSSVGARLFQSTANSLGSPGSVMGPSNQQAAVEGEFAHA